MRVVPPLLLVLGLLILALPLTSRARGNPKNGARLYNQFCVPCHGSLGNGQGNRAMIEGLHPPPRDHTNSMLMERLSSSYLLELIKNGGHDIRVAHIMPQWKHILSDKQILDIISHLRAMAGAPNWQQ